MTFSVYISSESDEQDLIGGQGTKQSPWVHVNNVQYFVYTGILDRKVFSPLYSGNIELDRFLSEAF